MIIPLLCLIKEKSFLVQKSFSKHKNHHFFTGIQFQNMKKISKKCFSHHLKQYILKCGKMWENLKKSWKNLKNDRKITIWQPQWSAWNFMTSKVFLEISLSKNLLPDFQIVGTNMLKNLSTLWIIYQILSMWGVKW